MRYTVTLLTEVVAAVLLARYAHCGNGEENDDVVILLPHTAVSLYSSPAWMILYELPMITKTAAWRAAHYVSKQPQH